MAVLVTGAAGFIGSHVCTSLLARGDRVLGVDNLNDYYDVGLKCSRLERLLEHDLFSFSKLDISDPDAMLALGERHHDVRRIVHLAAQAGVRHSLTNPNVYVQSNVMGQVAMLELARRLPRLDHFVYASSSSVYGGNTELPFSVDQPVEKPKSLYAATKRAGELIGYTYADLYGIPATGLRFFSVYGPWGRPDMAAQIFTRAILAGEPIKVFNRGEMWRDFTYIDDIVSGILRALDRPANHIPPHAVYNLGNRRAEKLTDFIRAIEDALGVTARMEPAPLEPGDMQSTCADIESSREDLGFEPTTPISIGIPQFVRWYQDYYGV